MGSPSLIIVLIIVVWVIVLAPVVLGNNKPIRRSGEGFDETRVLHEGGTATPSVRRRPKLTAADVHRHDDAGDYEIVEAVGEVEPAAAGGSTLFVSSQVIDVDETPETREAAEAQPTAEVSPEAFAVEEEDEDDEAAVYSEHETYLAPEDLGFEAPAADESAEAAVEVAPESEADVTEDGESGELAEEAENAAKEDDAEASEDDLAFAEARRGRGGFDPQRDARTSADRYQRRQRTFLGLIVATVLSVTAAVVAGGWVWVLPAISVALTAWFLVALRRVVRQERALRARRMRQLRRARLGVDVAQRPGPREGERRRAGAVIVNLDDESPDFEALPRYRQPEPDFGYEYDDYDRAS